MTPHHELAWDNVYIFFRPTDNSSNQSLYPRRERHELIMNLINYPSELLNTSKCILIRNWKLFSVLLSRGTKCSQTKNLDFGAG